MECFLLPNPISIIFFFIFFFICCYPLIVLHCLHSPLFLVFMLLSYSFEVFFCTKKGYFCLFVIDTGQFSNEFTQTLSLFDVNVSMYSCLPCLFDEKRIVFSLVHRTRVMIRGRENHTIQTKKAAQNCQTPKRCFRSTSSTSLSCNLSEGKYKKRRTRESK